MVWHLLVLSQSSKVKTESGSFSEAWVNFFEAASCHVLADIDLGDVIIVQVQKPAECCEKQTEALS